MPEVNWIGKQHFVDHVKEIPFMLLRKEPESSEEVEDFGRAGDALFFGANNGG